VGGVTPYERVSIAASVGKSADWALTGTPSPLAMEIDAAQPRYAVVMFGSNDVASRTVHSVRRQHARHRRSALRAGVVPILSTHPAQRSERDGSALIPRFNAVVRGIAQARQVPLMDLNREMLALPEHGLGSGRPAPERLQRRRLQAHARGLMFGYNTRNLLTHAGARPAPARCRG
jgi:hypothetical protein